MFIVSALSSLLSGCVSPLPIVFFLLFFHIYLSPSNLMCRCEGHLNVDREKDIEPKSF